MASAFHLFMNLPLEIRLSIWELTFTPRVIFLCHKRVKRTKFHKHLTLGSTEQFWLWHFFLDDNKAVSPIIALSVVKESRSFAISQGYRPWKLACSSDEIVPICKDVMWNPAMDTISCRGGPPPEPVPHRAFAIQFSAEAKALNYFALSSSYYWDDYARTSLTEVVDSFVAFESLREICIFIDVFRELYVVAATKRLQQEGITASRVWSVPESIQTDLLRLKSLHLGVKIPVVRVVDGEKDILWGDSKKLRLRCHPCPDLLEILRNAADSDLKHLNDRINGASYESLLL